MIIWLLALFLLALTATVSWFQGAIRASISSVGLLLGAFLAWPLSGPMKALLKVVGVDNPINKAILAPLIVFVVILIVVKIIAWSVHRKIEYIYTYKKSHGDQLRWTRLNQRVGLCVGLLNGTIYFLLLLVPIYSFGYLTTQLASDSGNPPTMRFLNAARKQLQTTKMDKVAAGVAPSNPALYDAFDILGLVYKNPLLESRLSRYPTILTLAELPEFQDLGNDVEFHNLWQSGATVGQLLEYPKVYNIVTNAALADNIKSTLLPDIKDLKAFLETGKSAKYDSEKILGRWEINLSGTFVAEKQRRPNISSVELKQLRNRLIPLQGVTFTAMTDGKVLLKRGDKTPAADGQPRVMAQGTWSKPGSSYSVSIDGQSADVSINDNKLSLTREGMLLVFERED